jgi:hypothetical protein
MAKRVVNESSLTSVADAIRDKSGTTSSLVFPEGFISAIGSITPGEGGITPNGTINITTNGIHDVTSFASANVNVPTSGGDIVNGDDIEVDSLSELHAWSKYTIGGTIIEEPVTDVQLFWKMASSSATFEIDYADSYEIVDNAISLVNPTTITLGSDTASRNAIKGKYVKCGNVYYIPSDARVAYGNYTTNKTIEVDKATKITHTAADGDFVCLVVSEDSNAYPQNGERGGFKYVYNGTLDSKSAVLKTLDVTPSASGQEFNPPAGYDGFSKVTVAGDADLVASNIKKGVSIFDVTGTYEGELSGTVEPTLQHKPITPSASNQVVMPDTGYDGFSHVTVLGDADLVSGNIKKGVNIFGVAGSYEGTGGTIVNEDIEIGSLSELHAWSKYTTANGSVVETQLTNHVIAGDYDGDNHMVDYADTYSIVNGEISLDNPSSANMYGVFDEHPVKGKYIYSRYQNAYYYVPADAVFTHGSDSNGTAIKATKVTLLTYQGATGTTEEFVSIVVSDDINAYPQNGEQDGYKYVYNGTLGGSGGGFTVTDDGAGNVTITSSAITDNNGNVVIA